jgi:hypothetical protein
MTAVMSWRDGPRRLTLRLAPGSKTTGLPRPLVFRVAGSAITTAALFTGRELSLTL